MSRPEPPSFDGGIRRVSTEIKKIIHKYTTWETMEDVDKAVRKYEREMLLFVLSENMLLFDIKNLERELWKMEKLYIDLKNSDYHWECEYKSHQEVVNWNKAVEACNLSATAREVYTRVKSIIGNLKESVETFRYRMRKENEEKRKEEATKLANESKEREEKEELDRKKKEEKRNEENRKWLKEWDEREAKRKEEARKLLQCLCNIMKEVLGDRVENVVASLDAQRPCYLRDSGITGGKRIMEINPDDLVIKDLLKRFDADKNDLQVRDAALVLFNHAEFYWKAVQADKHVLYL